MKVVFISDTHMRCPEVPECDLLIHCGDLTNQGTEAELRGALTWLNGLPAKNTVFIAGNHDFLFQRHAEKAQELVAEYAPNCIYLQDSSISIGRLKIYGSPWQPWFHDWAFNATEEDLARYYAMIPNDIDILVTHGPPRGYRDLTPRGERVGSESLYECVIDALEVRFHAFGHIHHGYGQIWDRETVYINCAVCDENYNLANAPIVWEI